MIINQETFKGDIHIPSKPIGSIIDNKVDPEFFTSLEDILRYIRRNSHEEFLSLQRIVENTIKEGYNIEKVNYLKD